MGRIADLKRITKARIEAFLDAIEKPEHVLPQLEKEMAQKVAEAANAEAKALAATRGAQRRIDEAAGRALRLENTAKDAIRARPDRPGDTARRAVAALIDAEQNTDRLRGSLEAARTAYLNARQVRMQLQANLEDLKARKKDIIGRSRRVDVQKAIARNRTLSVADGQDILDMVARMETRLDHDEAEIEARNHLQPTLDLTLDNRKFERKLHDAEVEARLVELKAKYGSPSNP